jgi:hypothetical protein
MPAFRFGSDTNEQLFADALKDRNEPFDVLDGGILTFRDDPELEALARDLGWDVPDPRSTTGVNAWTDISAQSVRANPPAYARGGQPLVERRIQTTFVGGDPEPVMDNTTRLLGILPARRSTRGQPL